MWICWHRVACMPISTRSSSGTLPQHNHTIRITNQNTACFSCREQHTAADTRVADSFVGATQRHMVVPWVWRQVTIHYIAPLAWSYYLGMVPHEQERTLWERE